MSDDLVYVAEIHSLDAGGTPRLLLAGTDGWCTRPTDTPADAVIEPRLKQPANYRRDLWGRSGLFGAIDVSYGECVLSNVDGGLDALAGHAFDGRDFVLWTGPRGGAFPAEFTVVLRAQMQAAECSLSAVTLRLRDRLQTLAQPFRLETGSNSDAIPRAFGMTYNAAPVLLDANKLIYQIGQTVAGLHRVPHIVRDNGVVLGHDPYPMSPATVCASRAVLDSTTPAAGKFITYPPDGVIRLGSPPAGEITVVSSTWNTTWTDNASARVGSLIRDIAIVGGIGASSIDGAGVAALDALSAPAPYYGYLGTSGSTPLDAITSVAASIGAWVGFDRLGALRMGQFVAPAGSPVETLLLHDCHALERVVTGDPGRGVPVWRVVSRYQRNWHPQTTLATSIGALDRARWAREWATVEAHDDAVLARHPGAAELTVEVSGAGITFDAGNSEHIRRLTLFGAEREVVTVEVEASPARLALLDLGAVVELRVPRYGWAAGKLFVVTGIGTDLARGRIDLTLWG